MNQAWWALSGVALAGITSLLGVWMSGRRDDRRADTDRKSAHNLYVRERRREAYGNFLTACLQAENRAKGGALSETDAQTLQTSVVSAQSDILVFGSDEAARASTQAMGEVVGALRGVYPSPVKGHKDGLSQLLMVAREELGGSSRQNRGRS